VPTHTHGQTKAHEYTKEIVKKGENIYAMIHEHKVKTLYRIKEERTLT
jgi:hypothetical protein